MIKTILNIFKKKEVKNIYQLLGETNGLDELVENFYTVMLTDSKAKECLELHPLENSQIAKETKTKLKYFLSGWLGGPNLFVENYGAPRMRMRHIQFKISHQEANQWLYCMQKALELHSHPIKKSTQKDLLNSFKALALRIINSDH